ncbi:MAG TPA: type II toxin-antitoxin system HicA family toxin [Stellaceae bacterium]|nr:type II toxin-antitoxin system HicA family toxin [Stellaceae bacterium]
MKFREFIAIIEQHGFGLTRTDGSHRRYEGVVRGRTELITVAYHRASDDILPRTLASMIRQSGLPKRLFR